MRKFSLLLAIILTAVIMQAQVSVTATAGTTGPTVYTTVNAAFAAINAGTHQGVITIDVTGNTTEPATPTALLKSGTLSNYLSILIKPSGGDWTVNSPNQTDNTVMIDLNGADNVTIDGDPLNTGTRHLSFVVSPQSGVRTAVFRLASATADNSDGAKNNTIKNCIITGSRFNVNASTLTYGIYMGSVYSAISITNLSAYDCTNNRFENNVITRCLHGITVNGNASFPAENLVIKNNTIGSPAADDNIGTQGVNLTNTSSLSSGPALVEGNDIRVGSNNTATTPFIGNVSLRGISLAQGNAGCIVLKNNIHDIINSELPTTTVGGQAYGIAVTVTTANNNIIIQNNFIRDIVTSRFVRTTNSAQGAYGIYVNAAVTGLKINYNTVVLSQPAVNGAATNYFSACLNFLNTTATMTEFQNNILVNKQSNDSAYIIRASPANIGGTAMNYNNYFVIGGTTTKFGIYNGVDVLSLANWQSATGKDANSINTNPAFVSATNLHIAPGASAQNAAGTPITGIIDDFDNETRNTTTPDIGADEFTAGGNASLTGGPFCGTGTTIISATGFSAGAGVTYLWQSSADITFTTPVDIGTPSTTYSNLNTGIVTTTTYFRLKVMDGLVGYSNAVTMQIDPLPNAGTVSGTSPLCLGATTTFTSNGQSGGTWTSSNPAVASIDPTTGFVTTIASGTTSIIYTVTSGFCNSTAQLTLTVNATPAATILYTGSPYCAAAGTAFATITGTTGGSFSAAAGLSLNPATGEVNLGTSTPGTYTVTYFITASGGCSSFTTSTSITISSTPSATIAYTGSPYCSNAGIATVTQNGSIGGTYSAPAGLNINSTTGEVTLGTSTPGIYTVTYSIPAAGGCSAFSTSASITVNAAPSATIIYNASPYCNNAGTATVTRTGTTGGIYSASPSGLNINSSTGAVTLATSTPGTYTVTYTIAAAGGCAVYTTTATITVTAAPSATIVYNSSPYCTNSGTAAVTRIGTAGGTYTASPAGLNINSSTGAVTLATSTPGTYTVIYTIAAAAGCTAFTTTASVTVNAVPNAGTIGGIIKLRVGQNSTLTSNGNTGGSWNSSNPQVATVNGSGTVSALSIGSTNITYMASAAGCATAMTDTVLTVFAATLTNIYPNPASDNVNVVIDATAFESITIVIIDMSGRVVITQSGNVRPGLNNRAINVSKLAGGIYTLKTLNSIGTETFTARFIKQQ